MKRRLLLCLGFLGVVSLASADTWYVSTNSLSDGPGIAWSNAFWTIQGGVDAAVSNDTVLVTNGLYDTGERVTPSQQCSNRVVIVKDITVRSVNGPEYTFIVGAPDPITTNGAAAIRCVYMSAGVLSGFTITNGYTKSVGGSSDYNMTGGGVNMYGGDAVITNCVLRGNQAHFGGGGAAYGTMIDSVFTANIAGNNGGGSYGGTVTGCSIFDNSADSGGGTYGGTINSCLITNNSADYGGGSYDGTLNNCTISDNSATFGGGSSFATLNNCIVWNNTAPNGSNWYGDDFTYSCTTPLPNGVGNITNAPDFISATNLRLRNLSPCINAGSNGYVTASIDLDKNGRIIAGTVDMGAYECTTPPVINITNDNRVVTGDVELYTVHGTNSEWIVGNIAWTNGANGAHGEFSALSLNFHILNIPIEPLDNVITVYGTNVQGEMVSDQIIITRDMIYGGDSPYHYVSTNGLATWPYTNWLTAARNIQDAVEAASINDTVWVTNGVYDVGERVTPGHAASNRVVIIRDTLVRSVNGSDVTFIVGTEAAGGGRGPSAVRCVYMSAGILSGFTITNGHTMASGDQYYDTGGGGINLYGGSGIVSNCTLVGNSAEAGGGSYYGRLDSCIFNTNSAKYGGGSYFSTLENCVLRGNSADLGGGSMKGALNNCTLSGNSANHGGGTYWGTFKNSIVWGNTSPDQANWIYNTFTNSCTTPQPSGDGNISEDPRFISATDLRLRGVSPCVNIGSNDFVSSAIDLAGNSRIIDNIVDMGAYECTKPTIIHITNTNSVVTGDITVYDIGGTINEWIIGSIAWTNHTTGDYGTVVPSGTNFLIVDIPIDTFDNNIYVYGNDALGDTASDSIVVTRTLEDGGNSPEHYVSSSGTASWPYASWGSAAHTIQDAVNAAASNDTVWVANGVYDVGETVTPGYSCSNRVVIVRDTLVKSVNGPDVTFIVGVEASGGGNGPEAVRCVYMSAGTLSGFTVTNGHTFIPSGYQQYDSNGGGINMYGGNGVVSNCLLVSNSASTGGGSHYGTLNNCIIKDNHASRYGGGSEHGTLNNCTIVGNSSDLSGGGSQNAKMNYCVISNNLTLSNGGGSYWGTLNSCIIKDNFAVDGGGSYGGFLNNCTLYGNSASSDGGGSYEGELNNCIVWNNTAPDGTNWYQTTFSYSCTTPLAAGSGNITNDPQFISSTDFHLQLASACIDTGNDSLVKKNYDFDGQYRIMGVAVDMGCYEIKNYAPGDSPIHYVSLAGASVWPYTSWADASTVIQYAVDAAADGDTVMVTNGVYDKGHDLFAGVLLSNRVSMIRPITLESVNGPDTTFIAGASDGGSYGPAAIRGVCLSANSVLSGFTITNGWTLATDDQNRERGAGGVLLYHGGMVTNCILTGNHCHGRGAGANCHHGGTIIDSIIHNNYSAENGGGLLVEGGVILQSIISGNRAIGVGAGIYLYGDNVIENCLIKDNVANNSGGGVFFENTASNALVNHCTIISNTADDGGGLRMWGGIVRNSIVYGNTGTSGDGNWSVGGNSPAIEFSLTSPLAGIPGGASCVDGDPLFADSDGHLQPESPAVDAGQNGVFVDMDGMPRPLDGDTNGTAAVDMGCYEVLNVVADSDGDTMTDGWETEYGLDPTDPSDQSENPDADSFDNREEYIADTDPNNSNSYFCVNSVSNQVAMTVYFDSSNNRLYSMVGCSNLLDGSWTNVFGAGPRVGIGGADTMQDTNVPAQGPFYRLEVKLP